MAIDSRQIEQYYQAACVDEIVALKPGNVHIFADGHGMTAEQFVLSATSSAKVLTEPNKSVGLRIIDAIKETSKAVGCNTNLGIVLLLAPMVNAVYATAGFSKQTLAEVIEEMTVEDANFAYQAISLANPGGLGVVADSDVHEIPRITLKQAMQMAAGRDLIARQYATNFQDIFELGIGTYTQFLGRWERNAWITTAIYLAFLSSFPDTHIERKFGSHIAQAILNQAQHHYQAFSSLENPKNYQTKLMQWDAELKAQGINPGTSADLTVATLFAIKILGHDSLMSTQ
jgi:triphosphoribosyl-dephospho-CoA synthase